MSHILHTRPSLLLKTALIHDLQLPAATLPTRLHFVSLEPLWHFSSLYSTVTFQGGTAKEIVGEASSTFLFVLWNMLIWTTASFLCKTLQLLPLGNSWFILTADYKLGPGFKIGVTTSLRHLTVKSEKSNPHKKGAANCKVRKSFEIQPLYHITKSRSNTGLFRIIPNAVRQVRTRNFFLVTLKRSLRLEKSSNTSVGINQANVFFGSLPN